MEHMQRQVPEGGGRIAHDATFGAFSGDTAVSTILAHPWTLSGALKGLKAAAVSGVGTLPEYRRLGLLRAQMGLLFSDMRQKGQGVATLAATQSAIYQRYGYVQAVSDVRSYCMDSIDIAFVDGDGGSCVVRRQDPSDELVDEALRPLYESFIEGRACAFGYDDAGAHTSAHRNFLRHRGSSQFPVRIQYCAVARDAASGEPRGYVLYRTVGDEPDVAQSAEHFHTRNRRPIHRTRFQKLFVFELVWADIDAYRSLWSFLGENLRPNTTASFLPTIDWFAMTDPGR
jgi:predicted acetyltransferase